MQFAQSNESGKYYEVFVHYLRYFTCLPSPKISYDLPLNKLALTITSTELRWLGHVLPKTHISLLAKPCDVWHQKQDQSVYELERFSKKRFKPIVEPALYGFRRWKKKWLLPLLAVVIDQTAWRHLVFEQQSQPNQ